MKQALRIAVFTALLGLSAHAIGQNPYSEFPSATPPSSDADATANVDQRLSTALVEMESVDARLVRLRAELDGLGDRKLQVAARLKARTRALYRLSRVGFQPLASGFDALLTHVGRLARVKRMVAQDMEAMASFGTRASTLRADLAELEELARAKRAELTRLQEEKRSIEESERVRASFADAFAHSAPFGQTTAAELGYGSIRLVDEEPEVASFATLRGQLDLPVGGAGEIRDARREDGPGLEFVAPPGASVRAVADGRVAFSDRFGSYGRVVIVDHGGTYYTVYGGLGEVVVRVGDEVSKGVRLGSVGAEFAPPSLFFEVRKGTRTLDARDWFGL